jgi:phosphomannomutase/phosphoglucomutase
MARKYGGQALMHMTGHAPIKETMRGNPNIILSGEMSGHIFFVENYFGIDDGLYAAARLLEIVSRSERPFSALLDGIPATVRSPEYKLPCSDTEKFKIVEQLKSRFSAQYKTILIDGVRIVFDETTWALVRASNTAPYLSLRMEADTEARLLEIKNVMADELEKYPSIGDKLNRQQVFSRTGRLGWV